MFIEQPPLLYRILFPEAVWRIKRKKYSRGGCSINIVYGGYDALFDFNRVCFGTLLVVTAEVDSFVLQLLHEFLGVASVFGIGRYQRYEVGVSHAVGARRARLLQHKGHILFRGR